MTEMLYRFSMTPHDYIWGGRKLALKYGKGNGVPSRIAESWESCEALGDSSILLKWVDTDLPTSAHVHPGRDVSEKLGIACENENEIWIIVEAEPESRIGIGFNRTVTRDEILKSLHERTLELLINNIEPRAGDCFVVPPGTIHYIDGGVTLLEATSKNGVTLRLYDWLRDIMTDRTVHVAESLAAMDFETMIPCYTFLPDRKEPYRVPCGEEIIELAWHEIVAERNLSGSDGIRFITILDGLCLANHVESIGPGESVLIPPEGVMISPGSEKSLVLETGVRKLN